MTEQHPLHREVGAILEVKDEGRVRRLRRIEGTYDYQKDKSRCGACGKLGFPWKGWWSGDGCSHVAVIETGQVFEWVKEQA